MALRRQGVSHYCSAPAADSRKPSMDATVSRLLIVLSLLLPACPAAAADPPAVPAEAPAEAARRHERVAERRKGVDVICHRGSSEHAHENTLEAFRATFELGGDGNEF